MSEKPRSSYTSINLTNRRYLRRWRCWRHRGQHPSTPELTADEFVDRLASLKEERNITSATWVGDEPALRLDILERATPIFSQNIISTNSTFELPPPAAICGVSVDGVGLGSAGR